MAHAVSGAVYKGHESAMADNLTVSEMRPQCLVNQGSFCP